MFARFRHLLWGNGTILESVAEVDNESPPPTFYDDYDVDNDHNDDHNHDNNNDDNDGNELKQQIHENNNNRDDQHLINSDFNDNGSLKHNEELNVAQVITVDELKKQAEQLIKDQMIIKRNFENFQYNLHVENLMENSFFNKNEINNQHDKCEIEIEMVTSNGQLKSLENDHKDLIDLLNSNRENLSENERPRKTFHLTSDSQMKDFYLKSENSNNINNLQNDRIVIEEVPSEMNTPSPTVENANTTTTTSNSSSISSTIDGNSSTTIINFSTDSSKIIIKPIQNNALACNAITDKLTEIAEVAESLDAVIRDIQDHAPCMDHDSMEMQTNQNCNNGIGDKKIVTIATTIRSNSSEDWHSRSTEDDSFVTASEGNFTPFSQTSSSYRTASARTNSSVISCDKNNSSDLDEMIFTTELLSPLNTSFEDSEQSFIIGQIKTDIKNANNNNNNNNNNTKICPNENQKGNKSLGKQFIDNGCQTEADLIENGGGSDVKAIATTAPYTAELNGDSTADIDELHSEKDSATLNPTPISSTKQIPITMAMPMPVPTAITKIDIKSHDIIESDVELEISIIQDAPTSLAITTESRHIDSVTPEVSICSVHSSVVDEPHVQIQQQRFIKTNSNNWRHNKYYENITKQTIKGFL